MIGCCRQERYISPWGGLGALFTLGLLALPHNPASFGTAMLAENFFQGAAFSVQNIIILRGIGHNNPLAATQFGLLTAAMSLPLDYMQMIDGNAYAMFGGVNGSYLADSLVSGAFCVILGLTIWFFRAKIARADRLAEAGGGPALGLEEGARGRGGTKARRGFDA